jgi:hypothetical protein
MLAVRDASMTKRVFWCRLAGAVLLMVAILMLLM